MKKLILLAAIAMFCGFGAKAQTNEVEEEIFVVVEVAPEFPGRYRLYVCLPFSQHQISRRGFEKQNFRKSICNLCGRKRRTSN